MSYYSRLMTLLTIISNKVIYQHNNYLLFGSSTSRSSHINQNSTVLVFIFYAFIIDYTEAFIL